METKDYNEVSMNNDEILNMPAGREMDVLVAELADWKKVPSADDPAGWCWLVPHGSTRASTTDSIPPFSSDISAAWQVVEKHPHYFSLHRSNETGFAPAPWGDTLWRCRFYAPGKFEAKAETAPLAICRAALLCAETLKSNL